MLSQELSALVSLVGLLSQTAGALLLAVLFAVLLRSVRRRRYFSLWALSWAALTVALTALVMRYTALSASGILAVPDDAPAVRVLYAVYQLGKLAHLLLLALGATYLVRGVRLGRVGGAALAAGAVAWTALSVLSVDHLDRVVAWQAPVAVVCLGWAAWQLWPLRSGGPGPGLARWTLLLMTALWLVYIAAFGGLRPPALGDLTILLVRYNSYFDLLLQMLLGYGMVLIVMEDLNREIDAAYSELAVAHGRLRHASLHDSLTGLLNRRAFDEGVGLAGAQGTFGAVVMIDADNLKTVNDSHGHAAGDALLRSIADTLRREVRGADKVYRWGGDEFLVVLARGRAGDVRPRLEAALLAAGPLRYGPDGAEVPLSVSIGAADYRRGDGMGAAVIAADAAMYEQKSLHRAAARARAQAAWGQ